MNEQAESVCLPVSLSAVSNRPMWCEEKWALWRPRERRNVRVCMSPINLDSPMCVCVHKNALFWSNARWRCDNRIKCVHVMKPLLSCSLLRPKCGQGSWAPVCVCRVTHSVSSFSLYPPFASTCCNGEEAFISTLHFSTWWPSIIPTWYFVVNNLALPLVDSVKNASETMIIFLLCLTSYSYSYFLLFLFLFLFGFWLFA